MLISSCGAAAKAEGQHAAAVAAEQQLRGRAAAISMWQRSSCSSCGAAVEPSSSNGTAAEPGSSSRSTYGGAAADAVDSGSSVAAAEPGSSSSS